ncbi:MAG: CheY-like chemotaxis protein [Myxococcota bacterium]|jgi:CheY-like chemotaxis protein
MPNPYTILIVDDDQANREMLAAQLEEAGIDSAVAGGVMEALEIISMKPVALVVTALYMAPLTGFDLLARLEGSIPVILMSAFASDEIQGLAMDRGVKAVMRKPFRTSELIDFLGRTAMTLSAEESACQSYSSASGATWNRHKRGG